MRRTAAASAAAGWAVLGAVWAAADEPAVPPEHAELARRLGDDAFDVRERAEAELIRLGEAALPAVRKAAASRDPEASLRARRILLAVRWSAVKARFARIAAQKPEDVDFETAVFDLARLESPDFDDRPYRRRLDEYAERVKRVRGDRTTADHTAFALMHVLGDNEKFSGDPIDGSAERYHRPENSFLPRVMDSKTGLPIALSAIHMLVAARLKIPVAGIGADGRYICMVRSATGRDSDVFIDPYAGKRFTRAEFRRAGISDDSLPEYDPRRTLERMIVNLRNSYQRAGDPAQLRRLEELEAAMAGR
jgi:regulator of sirC expression with transglutaminase-like and TPR domain